MNIPELEVFENHGLHNIDVDIEGHISVGQSAAGWATLRPTTTHPLFVKSDQGGTGKRVKFYWCPTDDVEGARKFRRCCQIWVIDSLARQDEAEHSTTRRKQALAWWEDSGLWLITDEPKASAQSLGSWWAGKLDDLQTDSPNQEIAAGAGPQHCQTDGQIYADLCDLFLSMARCSQVKSSLASVCRPGGIMTDAH